MSTTPQIEFTYANLWKNRNDKVIFSFEIKFPQSNPGIDTRTVATRIENAFGIDLHPNTWQGGTFTEFKDSTVTFNVRNVNNHYRPAEHMAGIFKVGGVTVTYGEPFSESDAKINPTEKLESLATLKEAVQKIVDDLYRTRSGQNHGRGG